MGLLPTDTTNICKMFVISKRLGNKVKVTLASQENLVVFFFNLDSSKEFKNCVNVSLTCALFVVYWTAACFNYITVNFNLTLKVYSIFEVVTQK